MTTYTAISATEVQSGKPLTESLLTRLANNCLAIQEGDPTAPRIQKEAFDDGEITIVDSAYSASTSVSFSFDHGEATAQDVHIFATASGYLNNGQEANLTITVDATDQVTSRVTGKPGYDSAAAGRVVSLSAGSHTISASGFGATNTHTFLQAMVLKK